MNVPIDPRDPMELFQILAKLGEGSYGSVYKALDQRDGKLVAIKVLEIDSEDSKELQKEINILRECDCEYIVRYKGSYTKDGSIWIVMEYCGAGSLCDLMAICERVLSEEQIAIVMKQSLMGLEYLHASKKIHRDIKSGNLLVNHEGTIKLADFGVSAELATTLSKRKTVIGTPYWMAPEVLQSTEYNGKADVWSLAITAIELAVGAPPHSNVHPMRAIFLIPNSDPPTLPDPSQWSADFNDFLKVCLVKQPDKRPSATQLLKHPFIVKAKSKAIIAQLVDECMQEIDAYRDEEAREAAAQAAAAAAGGGQQTSTGTMLANSTLSSGAGASGTMVFNSTMRSIDDGTMLFDGDADGTMRRNDGTMIQALNTTNGTMQFNSDTMIAGDNGTMVFGKDDSKKYQEPSYMKHIREISNGGQPLNNGASNKTKTLLPNTSSPVQPASAASAANNTPASAAPTATTTATPAAAASSAATPAPVTAWSANNPSSPTAITRSIADLYRTGKRVESIVSADASLVDLRTALITLNRSYEEEKIMLDRLYDESRKYIKTLLAAKEKK